MSSTDGCDIEEGGSGSIETSSMHSWDTEEGGSGTIGSGPRSQTRRMVSGMNVATIVAGRCRMSRV